MDMIRTVDFSEWEWALEGVLSGQILVLPNRWGN